jgi:hypothetical protein
MTMVARPLTLIACSRPEAATPARATVGEVSQQPPEHLADAPLPAPQQTDLLPIATIPGATDQQPKGHQHCHLDPLPAAAMWAMTSRNGQQLVEIAVAQPATIRTTGDLAAAVRAGCVPVAL